MVIWCSAVRGRGVVASGRWYCVDAVVEWSSSRVRAWTCKRGLVCACVCVCVCAYVRTGLRPGRRASRGSFAGVGAALPANEVVRQNQRAK